MSKLTIDEVDWCQREHQLQHYKILMKAIAWMNATKANTYAHTRHDRDAEDQGKIYGHCHLLGSKARAFFHILTKNPEDSISWSSSKRLVLEKQYKSIVKELLAL